MYVRQGFVVSRCMPGNVVSPRPPPALRDAQTLRFPACRAARLVWMPCEWPGGVSAEDCRDFLFHIIRIPAQRGPEALLDLMAGTTHFYLLLHVVAALALETEDPQCDGGWQWSHYSPVQEEERCTVERRDGAITYSEFIEQYAYKRPVIIQGITDNSEFRSLCRREKLLQMYGDRSVRLSTANTYSYDKVDVPFQEYVEHLLRPQDLDSLGVGESF
ncbi:hypothetical protein GDO81_020300 [Engystomops pustulosus]|uniref:Uncharacterized protein n=1 Tax=Engystomops pustulosus TaxID=76066 RepID=A0AAV6Z0I8_ENGPU|nr:hypothetical protein GDO81_020300 [Engystomops pustulosus]